MDYHPATGAKTSMPSPPPLHTSLLGSASISSYPCLSVDACRSLSSPSLSSFLTCLQLQPSTSSFIIIVVTDLTNTTHYSRRLGLSSGWKPSLEQSVTRHHISSDSRCFPESTQNLPVLSFIHALTDAYIPFSGLPVFTQKVKVKCATLLLECRQVLVSLPKAVSP